MNQAEAAYARYDGNNSASNESGMSLQQLYDLLQEVGLHWQAITLNTNTIRAWVHAGYPVIVAVAETSVHDLALGDAVPYPWNPVGNHIVVITGVDDNNNFLVRDSANIMPDGALRSGRVPTTRINCALSRRRQLYHRGKLAPTPLLTQERNQ